jgi:acetoin utilization deacetylase AcuC-like enzyme
MKVFYYDQFSFALPPTHRFPLHKYQLLRQRLQAENVISPQNFIIAPAATLNQIARAHDADYIERVESGTLSAQEVRRIGLPWSAGLVERVHRSVGGTIAVSRLALHESIAVSLGGGTHHACRDHGEGFCVYNDAVIAARTMQAEGRVKRVLIIDCDVHQGNGTAQITAVDPTIFTFSIHAEKNYPHRKFPSDLDISLPDDTGDEAYLAALKTNLTTTLNQFPADLAIYLAGADPHIHDKLGRLSLTQAGLLTRDQLVFNLCQTKGIPIAVTLAGGYGQDITQTVAIHLQTIQAAQQCWTKLNASRL